ncbi:MAG: hypothetical protein R3191_05635 [Anaerolineales bacterium]|nr:hypothetical protein [Anaerolineales bacterium]
MSMIYERDVVEAVVAYLEERGFEIEQALTAMSRGVDIIALRSESDETRIRIEARGETSSKDSRSRLDQPFNSAQSKDNVASALYSTVKMRGEEGRPENDLLAIALADTELHRQFEAPIHRSLHELGIGVFWVNGDHEVELDAPWQLE